MLQQACNFHFEIKQQYFAYNHIGYTATFKQIYKQHYACIIFFETKHAIRYT